MADVTRPRTISRGDGDQGFALIMTALVIVPLMLISAFAVDMGGWYATASQAQRAADASALAGVVWMPNFTKAQTVARQAAERNGFRHDPDGTGIIVNVWTPGEQQLAVSITTEGEVFLGKIVRSDRMQITRDATAEYALPVPLGSPRNFFGTGSLNTGYAENLWLSINPWCTDKVDGDRHQSRYEGNRPYGTDPTRCPSPTPSSSALRNEEYRDTGYEFYIDVPTNRSGAIEVRLYDPRYRPGQSPDNNLHNGSQSYKFAMFSADDTPLDETDNPPMDGTNGRPNCTKTYAADTPISVSGGTYLGSNQWDTLCTITTQMRAGRYVLRATNTPGERYAAGSNNFGIVARYTNASGTGLCDARSDDRCPRVYGKDAISVFADQKGATADFFLAEISPIHVGKRLEITLFDPGEGGNDIRILRPSGSGSNTWTEQTFSWSSSNGESGTNATRLDVTGQRFNGESVTIVVDLSTYSPPSGNRWWKIRYNFLGGENVNVTDRTTWSVQIIGDPVHLVD